MLGYAAQLSYAVEQAAPGKFRMRRYQPSVGGLGKFPGLGLRFEKYLSYPFQARRNQGTINHILDQTYAYLLNSIDASRSVVTVHDIIPILAWKGLVPGLSYPHNPLLFKYATRYLNTARAVMADSENTKRDLVAHCGVDDSRITVVHLGIDERFAPMKDGLRRAARASFGFSDSSTPAILIVGNQSYKNHRTCFKALSRVEASTDRSMQLVSLGGDADDGNRFLEESPLRRPVIYLRNLSVERLAQLYNAVDLLLFPSLYEGFGWPPLEAMASGTPVVTSNAASLVEVTGDAALALRPDDDEGIANAIRSLVEDPALRAALVERGFRNARRFTWARCGAAVAEVYDRVLGE